MISPFVRFLAAAILGVLFLGQPVFAFEPPPFQGDVLDEAGLLAEPDRTALLQRIRDLRENGGIWAAIYVTGSLQGDSVENAAVTTFEKWQLGSAQRDNGLLILIAPTERQMRIEVGYGLEGQITDALSKRVIDEIYKPAFREDRFAEGLMQGFEILAQAVRGENPNFGAGETPAGPAREEVVVIDWSGVLSRFLAGVGANLLPAFLYLLALRHGRARGRTGAGSKNGGATGAFFLFGFLGVFFGLFFGVFGAVFASDPEVLPLIAGMNLLIAGLFGVPLFLEARRYLSAAAYRRWQARERLLRIRRHSRDARPIFGNLFDPASVGVGSGGIKSESSRSSSSGSFGSSSSSSSGGGRSGGGGASGSW
ncbi:MAG: TPM domain-containing protein [Rhodocyclaceae bacterium]